MSLEIENPSPLVRSEVAGREEASRMAFSELGRYGKTTIGVLMTFLDANGVVLAGFCKSEPDDSDGIGGELASTFTVRTSMNVTVPSVWPGDEQKSPICEWQRMWRISSRPGASFLELWAT
ncbi:Hypothetical predicted protein [Prunus dulcis]|uniref:Uncharacterized protein n=1 Tax=Prunus dulcis TaxID=3755 RepID=A0A5E4GH91_PRUDU|nr:Hypothetical predicted protein [Prunus dulcis]